MTGETKIDTLEQARAFFRNDRFATVNGMTIEDAGPDRAVVRLELNETHYNAVGGVMGGVMFTLADFACAVASNFGTDTGVFVSTGADISYLRGTKGSVLTAEAVCIKKGRNIKVYDIPVTDDLGTMTAKATFTVFGVQ
ncbi:MAG: PaaI family thioesterase [Clostridia bacterium]|nr:PaaI family thioesterase [Clostridia bacterium]